MACRLCDATANPNLRTDLQGGQGETQHHGNMLVSRVASNRYVHDLLCLPAIMLRARVDMGGQDAALHVSVGVAGVLKTISSLTPQDSGLFFNFKGERVPW